MLRAVHGQGAEGICYARLLLGALRSRSEKAYVVGPEELCHLPQRAAVFRSEPANTGFEAVTLNTVGELKSHV